MRIRLEQISEWDESNKKKINDWIKVVVSTINGGLSIGSGTTAENLMCSIVNVITPSPSGTEFTVPHGLGRIPVGAWWLRSYSVTAPGMIYFSEVTTATSANVYLKCGTAAITGTVIVV